MENKVVGRLRDVSSLYKMGMSWDDIEDVLHGRKFRRWYRKNQKVVDTTLAAAAPPVAMKLFGVTSAFLPYMLAPMVVAVPAVAGGASFLAGSGVILLHMLIIGFLTLVVGAFLKFTGRADLIPLVAFISGAIVLKETLGLFTDIYSAIAGFIKL